MWPFRQRKQQEIDLRPLQTQLADVHERLERLEAAFKSFRGQVYKWRGKLEIDEEPSAQRGFDWTSCPLDDPRLTKAQVMQRLALNTPAGQARRMKPN